MTAYIRSGLLLQKRRRVLGAAEDRLRKAIRDAAVKSRDVERVRQGQLSFIKALTYELQSGTESRRFCYSPGSVALAGVVDELAESYDVNRLTVINLMNANAFERVRTQALSTFANAFILGRKKGKDG